MNRVAVFILASGTAVGASALSANADLVLSFGYQALSGSFAPGAPNTGFYQVNAVSVPNVLQSVGNVVREIPTIDTAQFGAGFTSRTLASFHLEMNLTGITATSATVASGRFIIRDIGGINNISGDVTGTWNLTIAGLPFFNGILSNVFVNSTNPFRGEGGTQFSTLGLPPPPLSGALQTLFIQFTLPNAFLAGAFANVSTVVQGQIVPTPGAIALAGLATVAGARRRRR